VSRRAISFRTRWPARGSVAKFWGWPGFG